MADQSNPIHIPGDSELAARIRDSAASGRTIHVETGGELFVVSVMEHMSIAKQPTEPEKVERLRESIRAATGAWKDFDAEGFKEYIQERRRTANRPPVEL